MPRIVAVIFAMIALCGALSVPLARVTGVDALSAYLALSPGGLDSVLIIATSTHVDLPLILAAQVVRLLVVMTVAPPLARFVVRRGLFNGRQPEP
jgi:membrane AbrB-like protein